MNLNKTYRIFNLILLVIFIILAFLLLFRTRNVSLLFADNLSVFNRHYIYILLILFTGIMFYFISQRLSKILWLTLKDNEKLVEEIALQTIIEEKNEDADDDKGNIKETISNIIPDEKDTKEKFAEELLINISKEFEIVVGIIYLKNKTSDVFSSIGTYAYFSDEPPKDFETGITLAGQVVKDKHLLNLSDLPENYITVLSGLGKGKPNHLLIIPILHKDNTIGIMELASFKKFDGKTEGLFTELAKKISEILNKFIK